MTRPIYPMPPTGDQVDDYHGVSVADPYRSLEDTDAPATQAWIRAQDALTARILGHGQTARDDIRARLADLWNVPRSGAPWRRGAHWFQLRNTGLQDQDVLWLADGPEAVGHILIDPNSLSDGGTTALSAIAASESGGFIACGTSEAGSDWRTWTVRRVDTGEALPDRIDWSKFSGAAWTHDDAGFFYGRYAAPVADATYEAPNVEMELCYHRLGDDPADDRVIFATPDEPEWAFDPEVSDHGRLLVLTIARGTDPANRIYVADLRNGVDAAVVRPLLDTADARYEHIATIDGTMYLLTDRDAPLGRVIAIEVDAPGREREVIPEGDDALERVALVGGRLAAMYLHHAHHRSAIFELGGAHVADVGLPGIGTVVDMAGRADDAELFLTWVTFTAPPAVIAVRMADGQVREVTRPNLAWDPEDFVGVQVFAPSADGTQVPLFLVHHRSVVPDGDVPTLLYGYGGFQISIGPTYKPEWLAWMERGGLLAVASLRGGGEYGRAWHDAGRLTAKQNVFDDFAGCLRWLAGSGWTRAERIGIIGRSNGGLLVGATLTQQPELIGAAVAEVGVMDMLRFHRFTIGWAWTSDYGSADDPAAFRTLLAYSPLHAIQGRPDLPGDARDHRRS